MLYDLFGGTPSPERFAKMMEAEIRAAGISAPIHFDSKLFMLQIEDNEKHFLALRNAYIEYQKAPRKERRGVLQRYVGHLADPGVSDSFDEVRPNLLPRVRERVFYHSNPYRIAKAGSQPVVFCCAPHFG
jgi:hypothetical protein